MIQSDVLSEISENYLQQQTVFEVGLCCICCTVYICTCITVSQTPSCRTVALRKFFVDSPVCQKIFRRATDLQLSNTILKRINCENVHITHTCMYIKPYRHVYTTDYNPSRGVTTLGSSSRLVPCRWSQARHAIKWNVMANLTFLKKQAKCQGQKGLDLVKRNTLHF